MRLLIAIFLPFLLFFTIGRPIAGIVCLVLQITLIGWVPAALWAVYALSQYKTDQRIQEAEKLGFDTIFVSKYNKIALKNTDIKIELVTKIEDVASLLFG